MQIRSKAARRLALGGAAFGAALALAWTPSPARAALLTYQLEGMVTFVSPLLSTDFSVGQTMHASVTYDTSAATDSDAGATIGLYQGARVSASVSLGAFNGSASGGHVEVHNFATLDRIIFGGLGSTHTGPDVNGAFFSGFSITLVSLDTALFANDFLPSSIDFADFDAGGMSFGFTISPNSYSVNATITSMSLVQTETPEPAALGLLGLGLAGLGALRRRRRRATRPLLAAALAGAALVAAGAPASAAVIDFEDNLATTNNLSNPVKSRGFTFQEQSNSAGYVADGTLCSPGCADNGTKYLYTFGATSVTTMTQDNGQAFSLVSVDLAELLEGPVFGPESAASVLVEGFLSGGGTVSQTFTLDGLNDSIGGAADFETFFFNASFANLGSARFTAFDSTGNANGYLGLDNVVTSAVPEPAALGLLGLGLAGLASLRRRRGRARRAGALAAAALASTALSAAPTQAAPFFMGLGDLPGGNFLSAANGISADGSTVVGLGSSTFSNEAFRWTAGGGMVGLGSLIGGVGSQAYGVSANGAVVVGVSGNATGQQEAFRWTAGGGMVGLGDLAGGTFNSQALAVSADGSVVVGNGNSSSAEAFRWTAGGGMVGLGDLAGGSFFSQAFGISADGTVIFGNSVSALGQEAFRWTGGGMVGLGDLAGGAFQSLAFGVNADGSVIVGQGASASGSEAFIWDSVNGMRELDQVLAGLSLDLAGWSLSAARGVSADGLVIAGFGINPQGQTEAWIASLRQDAVATPEPAALGLLGLGLAGLAARRRRG